MENTKILVVDDRIENILAMENLIDFPDIKVMSTTSGFEALNLLLDHDFGLAILDVQMPEISGFELAKLMRGVEMSKKIPIIFVTAGKSEEGMIFEGYETGAIDFLLKPLDPHIVRSKVRIFVELDQQRKKLKKQVRELKILKNVAEAATKAKGEFLANMSHEIRTPLSAVLGFAELLQDPELSAQERQRFLDSIIRNGKLLKKIVDDVLDLSKAQAQKIQIEKVDIFLPELVKDLRTFFQQKAKEKGINFTVNLKDPFPMKFTSDPTRLRQILNNLVDNALKFTTQGSVDVEIYLNSTQPGHLCFVVKDTGCGIDEEARKNLFKPFMQADSSTSRKYGGTGLGLSISENLAKALGGQLSLTYSEVGKGSVFTLTLRAGSWKPFTRKEDEVIKFFKQSSSLEKMKSGPSLQESQENQENPKNLKNNDENLPFEQGQSEINLQGVKILVIDDVVDNQILVGRVLQHYGAIVEAASNASDGMEMALKQVYDIILMDIQMPHVDGVKATSLLRSKGYNRPILAFTAHAMKEELDRYLAAGCDSYICKPVNRQTLIQMVARFANIEERKKRSQEEALPWEKSRK